MSTKAATVDPFQAVADPTRRAILALVAKRERSVTELVGHFDITQPAISQHLKILRASGIVQVRKDGRQRLYRVDFARLKRIRDWIGQFEDYWDTKLDALEHYLKEDPG